MANNKIISDTKTKEKYDSDGNLLEAEKTSFTRNIGRSEEPDYIKIYTRMWCEFNEIPAAYRELFLQLITRMSYCNSANLSRSQIVYTGKPISDDIMNELNWKKSMYQKGLKALVDFGAIRKISRGVYQISPHYAGKGEWKYNPKYDRGGIEDLIATFNFRKGTVNTKILWADDGSSAQMNKLMREGMGANANEQATLKSMDYTANVNDINEVFDNAEAEKCSDILQSVS